VQVGHRAADRWPHREHAWLPRGNHTAGGRRDAHTSGGPAVVIGNGGNGDQGPAVGDAQFAWRSGGVVVPVLLASDRWPYWGCDSLSQLSMLSGATSRRRGGKVRDGPSDRNDERISMSMRSESVSEMRTNRPHFGHSAYPRRECELGE
jgi:hypothetical protein